MRIFVVDDEIAVAETLGELVSDLGHRASVAHSAEAALTALDGEASDAILLDIYLPGMSGLEFLRRRRLRRTHTPVIGISQQPLISKSYKYIDYLVPGLVGFSVLTSPMFALVNISSQYKRDKIFKQLSLTPLTKTEWLLSKIIWYVVLTIISFLLMTVTGTIGFGAHLSFSLAIIPFLILGPFLFVSLGMLVGTVSKSVESAAVVGNLVTFPMMFLSGTFFPVATMPVYLQNIAHIRCLPCRGCSSDQPILSNRKPEALWMYVHRPTTDGDKLYLGSLTVGE